MKTSTILLLFAMVTFGVSSSSSSSFHRIDETKIETCVKDANCKEKLVDYNTCLKKCQPILLEAIEKKNDSLMEEGMKCLDDNRCTPPREVLFNPNDTRTPTPTRSNPAARIPSVDWDQCAVHQCV
jgi:hypothetical protein